MWSTLGYPELRVLENTKENQILKKYLESKLQNPLTEGVVLCDFEDTHDFLYLSYQDLGLCLEERIIHRFFK